MDGKRTARGDGRPVKSAQIQQVFRIATAGVLVATVGTGVVRSQEHARFECVDPDTRSSVSRVIGGSSAQVDMAPWQVSVQVYAEGLWQHHCGGSLIAVSWVLTAAHCFDKVGNLSIVSVMHGSQSLSSGGVRRGVAGLILHERYVTASQGDDIALIRLSAPFSASLSQIVIVQSRQLERNFGFPGACSVVTGWGTVEEREPRGQGPDRLRAVDLPIIDNATCADVYPGRITAGQVCAGYEQGTMDSCRGDSGGPLVVPGGPTGWTQIGVVSWGAGCARPHAYGVYTRVPHYIDWIMEQTSK